MERKRKNITEQEEEYEEEKVDNSVPILSAQEMAEHDRVDRDYFDKMPPGYRFVPTGEELIVYYLNKKVSDSSSLPINRIRDANIYNYHPQELASAYKLHRGKEWYFFSKRTRKCPNSQIANRNAGNGYWRITRPTYSIYNDQGIRIGTKNFLVYYERRGNESCGIRTDWIMYEYRNQVDNTDNVGLVDKRDAKDMELNELVLCVISNKSYKEEVAIGNQQYNQLPSNQNPTGHTFLRHDLQLEPNPTTNQGQDGASFFNRYNLHVPSRNVKQRLDWGSSYNRAPMHMQNVQVSSPNTTQRQDDTRFYNRPSNLLGQNLQLVNTNIIHGLGGARFDNRPNLPFQNVQVPNSNTNQFPYGAGFDNMGSLPMQNMVRVPTQTMPVPNPIIRQGLPTLIHGPDGRNYYNTASNLSRKNVQVSNLNITHGLNGNRPRSPLHNVQELNSNRNLFPSRGGFNNMVNFPTSHYDQQQNLYGRNRTQAQLLGNNNANNQQVITPDLVEDESYDSHSPQEALQGKNNLNSKEMKKGE